MKSRKVFVLALVASALAVTQAVGRPTTDAPAPEPPGKATYDRLCKSCHGDDGSGNPIKAKALKLEPEKLDLGRDEAAARTLDELRVIVLAGQAKMPGYAKKLKPEEVEPVLAYTVALAKCRRAKLHPAEASPTPATAPTPAQP